MKTSLSFFAYSFSLAIVFAIGFQQSNLNAQAAGPEYDIFKKDVGEWDVEITTFMTESGKPEVTKGTESNRMMGGFWLIANFEGNLGGQDFKGHGIYGYDQQKRKYVGTWADSLGPVAMQTSGDYDKETETLTVEGESVGPDGSPAVYKMATCYKDGKRVMTMYMTPKDGKEMKFFEMVYTKKKMEN